MDLSEDFIAKCDYVLESTTEGAAFKSGLPHNKMTASECICFPDIAKNSDVVKRSFLAIRNRMLQIWLDSPANELTWSNAMRKIRTPAEPGIVKRVHAYLQRYGFINFGSISYERELTPVNRKKVIVIGAGIAGNAAAHQLHLLGMDVTVLEARDYCGGRICTIQKQNDYIDIGAQTLDGIIGNPIAVLMEQMELQPETMPTNYVLYDFDGEPIPKELCESVKAKLMHVLHLAKIISIQTAPQCESLSLGQGIHFIIEQLQIDWSKKQARYDEDLLALISIHDAKKFVLNMRYQNAMKLRRPLDPNSTSQLELYTRPHVQFMAAAMDYRASKKSVEEMLRNRPSKFYVTLAQRRIMDWFIAHYEFKCGASVEKMSLKHFPLRNRPDFMGPMTSIKRGHTSVIHGLGNAATQMRHMVVTSVDYSTKAVKVYGHNSWTQKPFCMSADVVLSTLPLGVLKKQQVLFQPPLPYWKTEAIKRMGLGTQVKIWLRFRTIFWEHNELSFGKVNYSDAERGDAYYFYSLEGRPTMVAFVSGEAATLTEDTEDAHVVLRCMEVLQCLFGMNIPFPCEAAVTHWSSNLYSQGACSYVAVGGDPEDYNALAFPVARSGNGLEPRVPSVFFAGEHTSYKYPATVHGAFFSGLREAGRIADCFLGRLEGTPADAKYSLTSAFNATPREETLDISGRELKKLVREVTENNEDIESVTEDNNTKESDSTEDVNAKKTTI